jgi:hypothetical protein
MSHQCLSSSTSQPCPNPLNNSYMHPLRARQLQRRNSKTVGLVKQGTVKAAAKSPMGSTMGGAAGKIIGGLAKTASVQVGFQACSFFQFRRRLKHLSFLHFLYSHLLCWYSLYGWRPLPNPPWDGRCGWEIHGRSGQNNLGTGRFLNLLKF